MTLFRCIFLSQTDMQTIHFQIQLKTDDTISLYDEAESRRNLIILGHGMPAPDSIDTDWNILFSDGIIFVLSDRANASLETHFVATVTPVDCTNVQTGLYSLKEWKTSYCFVPFALPRKISMQAKQGSKCYNIVAKYSHGKNS